MDPSFTYTQYQPQDMPTLVAVQTRAVAACPDTGVFEGGFWLAPGFDGGRNIVCAWRDGALAGYAACLPTYWSTRLGAHILWTDIRVDPALPDGEVFRATLLARSAERARDIRAELAHPAVLSATFFAAGQGSLDFLRGQGFQHYESIFSLRRDLADPLPEGLAVRAWRMGSEAEQLAYMDAYHRAFGYPYWTLEGLRHFMQSALWSVGVALTAFDGEAIAGSMMVWHDPGASVDPGAGAGDAAHAGTTERVFTVAEWRGRGVASVLLREGMAALQARGMRWAGQDVVADNARALAVYERLRYVCVDEARSFYRPLA